MANILDLLDGKQKRPEANTTEERVFGGDDNAEVSNKKSLKINNSNSTIKTPAPRIDISANAQRILADKEIQNKLGWDLTSKMIGLFKNKKLQENKTQIEKDAEAQVLQDYTEFAKLINNDPSQEEGLGSIVFSIAIIKCALLQRDVINDQGYQIELLKRKISALEAEINTQKK